MRMTQKQLELLRLIYTKNPDGTNLDIDQITEGLSWKPSKQSLQFSLRALIGHGLIKKTGSELRRDRRRTVIEVTELGKHFFNVKNNVNPMLVSEELDELENLISPATFTIE